MDKITSELVGQNIAKWRACRGIQPSDFAKAIGYRSPSGLIQLESGGNFPSFPRAIRIAHVLRGPLDTLVTGLPKEKTILETEFECLLPKLPQQAILGLLLIANQLAARPYSKTELERLLGVLVNALFP